MNNNTKFFAGLLAGISVGAVIGILMAPEKGTQTYRKIEGAVKDAAHDIADFSNDVVKTARVKAENMSKKA